MDTLAVGVVRTSHGVRGYVKIRSFSGETEHFFQMKEVLLKKDRREKVYHIEDVKPLGDDIIIKFAEVSTPEDGKLLAGSEIWVDRELAAPLKSGEYYVFDLVGCSLIFNGEEVGSIKTVVESGMNDLLEVETTDGVHLVPLIEQFIGEIDIHGKSVELKDDWVLK